MLPVAVWAVTPPPPRLGARLAAVARHVLPGEPLADIGADHAFLAIALVANGTVPTAVAIDRLVRPLAVARHNIERYGLTDRVAIRAGDGLAPLLAGEAATVVIAGVGGRAIWKMLQLADPAALGIRRMVLQPQSEAGLLVTWLADRWGEVLTETVDEQGRGYVVCWVDVGGRTAPSSHPANPG